MAILDFEQIKKIALSEVDDWINIARKDSELLILHYYGTGTDEYLTKISGLENDDQLKLRKKHAISNTFLTENLMRPLDNIWSAKGGAIKIELKGDTLSSFQDKLNNVKDGYSLKNYLKDIWKDKLIADPNGVIFVEADSDGKQAYLTQKSIFHIKNMPKDGTKPEYICFESHKEIKEDKKEHKILWLVDDAYYFEIKIRDEEIEILQKIPNPFPRVPAIINSSIVDTQRKIKLSPIHKQVELLNKYLINNSVKEIYQFLHGYPVFWMYTSKCKVCEGSGYVSGEVCSSCNGSGHNAKKDVSDVIALKPPTEQGQPVIAPDVAGYVQPDLDTWREQRTELDWTWNLIYYSHWGATIEKKDNETATGRFIDVQPVNNRLNSYADIVETVHQEIIDLLGSFYFTESYKGSSVNYGRRYLIETPDQVWEKYEKAKEKKAPVLSLDNLLEQYYESEYQRNELVQKYYLKLIRLEPFVHSTVEEVISMPISGIDKNMKIYFSDWIKTKMVNEIVDTDLEKLKTQLKEYSQTKILENGTREKTSDQTEGVETT